MADTKKNALAELAERLKGIHKIGNFNGVLYEKMSFSVEDIRKASRIIAELAKVSDWHWQVICDDFCTAGDFELHRAIGRCLAIAEEVDRDEGK